VLAEQTGQRRHGSPGLDDCRRHALGQQFEGVDLRRAEGAPTAGERDVHPDDLIAPPERNRGHRAVAGGVAAGQMSAAQP